MNSLSNTFSFSKTWKKMKRRPLAPLDINIWQCTIPVELPACVSFCICTLLDDCWNPCFDSNNPTLPHQTINFRHHLLLVPNHQLYSKKWFPVSSESEPKLIQPTLPTMWVFGFFCSTTLAATFSFSSEAAG